MDWVYLCKIGVLERIDTMELGNDYLEELTTKVHSTISIHNDYSRIVGNEIVRYHFFIRHEA